LYAARIHLTPTLFILCTYNSTCYYVGLLLNTRFFKQGYIPIGNLHYGWIYNYGLGLHTSNSSVFDSLKIVTL